jgi:hypothetical protein
MNEKDLTFKTSWRNDAHNWGTHGNKITSQESLAKIRYVLDKVGSIIVEHWVYCGSQAPRRLVFDDYEDFIEYLKANARAGDIISIWSMHELLNEKNQLVSGKCPAEDGSVPEGGAY